MNQFLIPANSKKSMLIFGYFNPFDLILFVSGIATTLFLLIVLNVQNMVFLVIALLPLFMAFLLVFPVPNYHNVLTVLICIYNFYTQRQKFIWKGWCINGDSGEEKSSKK